MQPVPYPYMLVLYGMSKKRKKCSRVSAALFLSVLFPDNYSTKMNVWREYKKMCLTTPLRTVVNNRYLNKNVVTYVDIGSNTY